MKSLPSAMLLSIASILTLAAVTVSGQSTAELRYELYEESPKFTFVGTLSRGANISQTATYLLLKTSTDFRRYFQLQQTTGILRTAQKLDREAFDFCQGVDLCQLPLLVLVQTRSGADVYINVFVKLMDKNDMVPTFNVPRKTFTVKESARPGLTLALPSAEDPDGPKYGLKSYELLSTFPEFKLETDGGAVPENPRLVLMSTLDREKRSAYQLTVKAMDKGSPPKVGSLEIVIVVSDVNDHRPAFSNSSYTASVPENLGVGSLVRKVTASDADSGKNGEIVYGFSDSTLLKHGKTFTINNGTGEIRLAAPLDYETVRAYVLVITARDNTPDSIPVDARLHVTVRDVNDGAPQLLVNALTGSGRVEVAEGARPGVMVCHVSVEDSDSGAGGQFDCTLTHALFRLESISSHQLRVITRAVLDREASAQHALRVICADRSPTRPLTSTTTLTVHVTDVNDWAPEFTFHGQYRFQMSENNPHGAFVGGVHAVDRDEGRNAALRYRIVERPAAELLALDPVSGNITARRPLDREKMDRINFTVVASDQSETPRSASASVHLVIKDENDEPPRFQRSTFEFSVFENETAGTAVGRLIASDTDTADFSQFRFTASGERALRVFKLDPVSGNITTRARLDREETDTYELRVKAVGVVPPRMSSDAVVRIRVLDRNDHSPEVLYPAKTNNTVSISNSAPVGSTVVSLRARDADAEANARLSYFLISGNRDGHFSLGQDSGVLLVRRGVQQYTLKQFILGIRVQDGGDPPRATDVTLNLIVNASLAAATDAAATRPPNSVIVTTVVVVTVVVVGILVVAIVCVWRRDLLGRLQGQKRRQLEAAPYSSSQSYDNAATKDSHGYVSTSLTARNNPLNVNDLLLSFHSSPRRPEAPPSHDSSLDSAVTGKREVDFSGSEYLVDGLYLDPGVQRHLASQSAPNGQPWQQQPSDMVHKMPSILYHPSLQSTVRQLKQDCQTPHPRAPGGPAHYHHPAPPRPAEHTGARPPEYGRRAAPRPRNEAVVRFKDDVDCSLSNDAGSNTDSGRGSNGSNEDLDPRVGAYV